MTELKNAAVRNELKKRGIYQYELAEMIGISEFTLVKRLRKELSKDEQKQLISVIKEAAKKRGE